MGGAIAVHAAAANQIPSLLGLCVIDVVEGTAMDALNSMQSFLRSRPKTFKSLENAIEWRREEPSRAVGESNTIGRGILEEEEEEEEEEKGEEQSNKKRMKEEEQENRGVPVKAVLLMAPCLVCLYVNGVMLFALSSKSAFLESSRYLLFGHLLLSDSLHLVACVLLYMIAVAKVRLTSSLCMFVLMMAEAIAAASPLTLAVMSLERYVAICLPLRHAQISTQRRTGATIAVLWCVAMVDPYVEVLYYMALGNRIVTLQTFCSRNMLAGRVSTQLNTAFTGLYFLLVGAAITYTYICILLAARSATATSRASKAHRTVLLHMLQLCLCLTSTMYNMMNSTASMNASRQMGYQIQYSLVLCFIIFPRFLNPLIYGLRDNAFRAVFKHYFLFRLRARGKQLT
ncbi:unnamed protein product [Merluccius merluccius]